MFFGTKTSNGNWILIEMFLEDWYGNNCIGLTWSNISFAFCLLGDLNNDDLINITDILIVVSCITEEYNCNTECSDLNRDGSINVVDIIEMVQLIWCIRIVGDGRCMV